VLGPQETPVVLDPVAAQNRFQLVVRQFIEAIVHNVQALAIFLDDLQWADPATFDLVHYLLRGNRIPNLLLVGAYRDTDVDEAHPISLLNRTLDQKSEGDRPLHHTILVKPLSVQDVNRLVADTLHADSQTTLELASLVHDKTDGNPFFTNQMLLTLHAQGAFAYDASRRRWQWSLEQVAKAELGANVVAFLVKKLATLSSEATEVLKIAACLGNQFDLPTLVSVHGQGMAALARGLWEAITNELVIPLDHKYRLLHLQEGSVDISAIETVLRFQHDRILHAAYAMIPEDERPDLHHRIGSMLLKAFRQSEAEVSVFTVVNHLNLGSKQAGAQDSRRELAELNVLAGRKAMSATAFGTAVEYFRTAQNLFPDEEWARLPELRFSVSFQHAESLFLAGQLPQAQAIASPLLDLADGDLAKASVYRLRSKIREFQGDLFGAIDEIRNGLKPFGLVLPESKAEIGQKVGEGLGRMQQSLARVPVDALLDLGAMTDAGKIEAMRLLAQVVPAAIQVDYALYMVATLMMMDLTMTHGTTSESCKCIADCGIIYSSVLGDYQAGYRLGKAAFTLIDKLKVARQKPAVCFSFTYVSHLRKHYQEGLDYYGMSYQSAMEVGDLQHAAYARAHKVHLMMWIGANLQTCQQETQNTIAFLKESNGLVQLMLADIVNHAIDKLQTIPDEGREKDFAEVDARIMATVAQTKNVVLLVRVSQYNAFLHLLLGDLEAAEQCNATAESVIFAAGVDFPLADHYLVQSLILLDKLRAGTATDRDAAMEKIGANLAKLEKLADNCPENFAHKRFLVAAELSATKGGTIETTLELYKQALASIGKGDFVQMVALINERQGMFWIGQHNDTIAQAFLREAHYHYGQWGAFRKVAAMEEAYHTYFALRDDAPTKERETRNGSTKRGTTRRSSRGVSNAVLDITSLIKTTQAISGEIRTENLLRTLLQTIIENAGAQSGCLLLSDGGATRLGMVAFKAAGSDDIVILEPRPYGESDKLCREIVEYVERTRESVVLHDAAAAGGFATNAYIAKNAVKSVLCMPVLHKNVLKGVVYLENNLADHVFTTERLNVLSILAAQASISIENAQLYQDMESKVLERTKLLHQANEKLRRLTLIDPLTRLNNRRYFHDFITGASERYIRKLQRSLTSTENRNGAGPDIGMGVFIIDIDHFKEVNDSWGHAAGDNVLVAISQILTSSIRADDHVVRWGGEEFLVILNNTSLAYLDRFARKILASVRDTPIQLPDGNFVSRTCSIGYMQIPFDRTVPDFLTLEQTIRLCDCAMYLAKEGGRNRAVGISLKEGEKADEPLRAHLLNSSHQSPIDTSRLNLRHILADG
jgi:histidine kinase